MKRYVIVVLQQFLVLVDKAEQVVLALVCQELVKVMAILPEMVLVKLNF